MYKVIPATVEVEIILKVKKRITRPTMEPLHEGLYKAIDETIITIKDALINVDMGFPEILEVSSKGVETSLA